LEISCESILTIATRILKFIYFADPPPMVKIVNFLSSVGEGERVKRPSWDEYFMKIAHLVKERSTCLRRKVGAVLVKERRILATGYNGTPKGLPHCEVVGCLREKMKVPSGERQELCRGLHAEQNAIVQAAVFGVSTRGATLYTTTYPCVVCAKLIINAEIKEVIYDDEYEDELAKEILKEAGIKIRKYKKPT